MKIDINSIDPNPRQPRTVFDEEELAGLAKTIKKHGIILPLAVELHGDRYVLIDGERRLRAARLAGLQEVDVEIKPSTNGRGTDRLTKALIANIQRSSMGPVDEGRAYAQLVAELGSAEAVTEEIGVSNATVSLRLSLLEFPEEVQKLYNLKRLPMDTKVIAAFKRLKRDEMIRVATTSAIRRLNNISILRLIALTAKKRGGGLQIPEAREEADLFRRSFQCAGADRRQGTAREYPGDRGQDLPGVLALFGSQSGDLQRMPAAGLPEAALGGS